MFSWLYEFQMTTETPDSNGQIVETVGVELLDSFAVLIIEALGVNSVYEGVSAGQDHRGNQSNPYLTWPVFEKGGFQ